MGCGTPPVRIVVVCDEKTMFTDGTTTPVARARTSKRLENIGPFIAGVTAHAKGQDMTTNFQYQVTGAWSYDGEEWTPFSGNILANQTADGSVNSSQYTTKTDFGLHVRFYVSVSNTTGTNVESGTVSVTLAIELIS